eukprot:jgi/Bigna1/91769/estExt_fgenesh1_pg.C_1180004
MAFRRAFLGGMIGGCAGMLSARLCSSGIEAEKGGARRLELCANLIEGGVTPSPGMFRVLREKVGIPIHVLIRPRGGDFLYSDLEIDVMKASIEAFKAMGADGVVLGTLDKDGAVDRERMGALVEASRFLFRVFLFSHSHKASQLLLPLVRPMSVTFHRAFDVTRDPIAALDACVALEVDRILTSGQQPSAGTMDAKNLVSNTAHLPNLIRPCVSACPLFAECGCETDIRTLVNRADGEIGIIAGGGVTVQNVRSIMEETGISEAHGTAGRVTIESKMAYRPEPPLYMGGEKRNTSEVEFSKKAISATRVLAYVSEMESAGTLWKKK